MQASGEKTSAQFTKFLEESLDLLAEHSVDGAIHFICCDWRHWTKCWQPAGVFITN
jgi:hypothetical protein